MTMTVTMMTMAVSGPRIVGTRASTRVGVMTTVTRMNAVCAMRV